MSRLGEGSVTHVRNLVDETAMISKSQTSYMKRGHVFRELPTLSDVMKRVVRGEASAVDVGYVACCLCEILPAVAERPNSSGTGTVPTDEVERADRKAIVSVLSRGVVLSTGREGFLGASTRTHYYTDAQLNFAMHSKPSNLSAKKFADLTRFLSFAVYVVNRPAILESLVVPLRADEMTALEDRGVDRAMLTSSSVPESFEKGDWDRFFAEGKNRAPLCMDAIALDWITSCDGGYFLEAFVPRAYSAYRATSLSAERDESAREIFDAQDSSEGNSVVSIIFDRLLEPRAGSISMTTAEKNLIAFASSGDEVCDGRSILYDMKIARLRIFLHHFIKQRRKDSVRKRVRDNTSANHVEKKVSQGRMPDPNAIEHFKNAVARLAAQIWDPLRSEYCRVTRCTEFDLQNGHLVLGDAPETIWSAMRADGRDVENLAFFILLLIHGDVLPLRPQVTVESTLSEWTTFEREGRKRFRLTLSRRFKTDTSSRNMCRSWDMPDVMTGMLSLYIHVARRFAVRGAEAHNVAFVDFRGEGGTRWVSDRFNDFGRRHLGIPKFRVNILRTFRLCSMAENGSLNDASIASISRLLQTSEQTIRASYVTEMCKRTDSRVQDQISLGILEFPKTPERPKFLRGLAQAKLVAEFEEFKTTRGKSATAKSFFLHLVQRKPEWFVEMRINTYRTFLRTLKSE